MLIISTSAPKVTKIYYFHLLVICALCLAGLHHVSQNLRATFGDFWLHFFGFSVLSLTFLIKFDILLLICGSDSISVHFDF